MSLQLHDNSLLINGGWINGAEVRRKESFDITNPATGEHLATICDMGVPAALDAIDAANTALGAWRLRSIEDRAAIVLQWADLIERHVGAVVRHGNVFE